MNTVGFTASVAGIIQLTGALTSISYGYIVSYKQAPKALRDLIAELNTLQEVLVVLQSQSAHPSPALQKLHEKDGAIETCFRDLQDLASKLELKRRRDRLMWPLKENETIQHLSVIERQKSLFLLAINSDTLSFSKVIVKGVGDTNIAMAVLQNSIQAKQIAKTRERVLNWLYSQKIDEKHLEISGRRQKNTGDWLLKTPEFQAFIKGTLNRRLLWGYGIPGAGKSFLSSVAIDYLQAKAPTENYGIAYIYFDYKEQLRQTSINVISSLVKQLASQIPHMPTEIEELYKKIEYRAPTVEELYAILLTTLNSFNRVFLVFDALDECDENTQRRELLPLFHRMGKSGINLFLTSREYPDDIRCSLRDAAKIELAPKKEDITAYIESKIDENTRASRLVQQEQCKDRIISEILDCSKGMFLLAQFHIEYICQQVTTNQLLKALDQIGSSSIGERPLDPTYDRAMKNIRKQAKPCADLALKILSWLVTAKRTLTVDELRVALSVEPHQRELDERDLVDKETLLDVCASLVTIDDNSKTIHLAHYTVQEYLVEKIVTPADVNAQIATACATFLSFDAFAGGALMDKKTFESLYESYPFLRYAAEELQLHIKSCGEERSITNAILTLIHKPGNISFYMQILMRQDLESGPNYYSESCESIPPLTAACSIGCCGAVRELFQKKADYSARNSEGMTALHSAVSLGHEAVVQFLLETGADHSIQDNSRNTPLHYAALCKSEGTARILLEKGADPSIRNNDGKTALHVVASVVMGCKETVRILLEMGADHSILDNSENTALHEACLMGSDAIVQMLLERGADHSIKNNRGLTALHMATKWGRKGAIKFLLDKGADPSIQDNARQTPLFLAVSTIGPNETVVQLLLGKGANHSIPDNSGQTVLHKAISVGNGGIVRLLLDAGADVSVENRDGNTALDLAMRLGKEAMVQLLLDKGAEFSVPHENWRETVHETSLKIQNDMEELKTHGVEIIKTYDEQPEIRKPSRYDHLQRLCLFVKSCHILSFPVLSMFRLFSVGLIMVFCFIYFWFFL